MTPVEEGHYVSLTALPDGYALLQYNSENYGHRCHPDLQRRWALWSSAGEAQQYTYASYLTNTANGPLLTAHRDNSDSSNLSDVLDMEGNLLLRRLGRLLQHRRSTRRLLYRAAGLRLRPDGLHRPVALPRKIFSSPATTLAGATCTDTEVFDMKEMISRRSFLRVMGLGFGAAMLTACKTGTADSPADSPAASVPDPDTPVPS